MHARSTLFRPVRSTTLRRGFTLVDLLMGMMITTMMCAMMAGVMFAANAAWDHTTGSEDAAQQARAGIDRIKYMVSQAGVYKLAGQPTVPGIAVVNRTVDSVPYPEILVLWTGGQNGGMAASGVQTRLPLVNELVIYAPQSGDPSRLVEITSALSSSIDFTASTFTAAILAIVDSTTNNRTLLSDRVHISDLPSRSAKIAGCIFFEAFESPTAAALQGVSPGSAAWNALTWSQGVYTSSSGLRQVTVRMELQFNLRANSPNGSLTSTVAFPFTGSASYRYVYTP